MKTFMERGTHRRVPCSDQRSRAPACRSLARRSGVLRRALCTGRSGPTSKHKLREMMPWGKARSKISKTCPTILSGVRQRFHLCYAGQRNVHCKKEGRNPRGARSTCENFSQLGSSHLRPLATTAAATLGFFNVSALSPASMGVSGSARFSASEISIGRAQFPPKRRSQSGARRLSARRPTQNLKLDVLDRWPTSRAFRSAK